MTTVMLVVESINKTCPVLNLNGFAAAEDNNDDDCYSCIFYLILNKLELIVMLKIQISDFITWISLNKITSACNF